MKALKVLACAVVFVAGVLGGSYAYHHLGFSKAEANSIVPTVTFKDLSQFKK